MDATLTIRDTTNSAAVETVRIPTNINNMLSIRILISQNFVLQLYE